MQRHRHLFAAKKEAKRHTVENKTRHCQKQKGTPSKTKRDTVINKTAHRYPSNTTQKKTLVVRGGERRTVKRSADFSFHRTFLFSLSFTLCSIFCVFIGFVFACFYSSTKES